MDRGRAQTGSSLNATRQERVALQHALTARLLGVDFLPAASTRREAAPILESKPGNVVAPPGAPPLFGDEPAVPAQARAATRPPKAGRPSSPTDAMEELRSRHARECPYCTADRAFRNIVFGEGNPTARLMFVGEAPGEEEDRTGRPFVGRAGQKLDDMIKAMGLRREDVYIANVLKGRPPNNATPTPEEAAQCGPFLREQVEIVSPEVIVTLGNPATHFLLETTQGITKLRGTWQDYRGTPVMPTFHPAYLLRNYSDDTRRKVWSDLKKVMERLGLETSRKPA